jgi:hypothetical protein
MLSAHSSSLEKKLQTCFKLHSCHVKIKTFQVKHTTIISLGKPQWGQEFSLLHSPDWLRHVLIDDSHINVTAASFLMHESLLVMLPVAHTTASNSRMMTNTHKRHFSNNVTIWPQNICWQCHLNSKRSINTYNSDRASERTCM